MTRETKVGLIVGLAFIVVFAVILSHKGGQPRAASTSDLGPLVDASSHVPAVSSETSRTRSRQPGGVATTRTEGRTTRDSGPTVGGSARPQPATPEIRADHPRALTGTEPPDTSTNDSKATSGAAKPRVPLPEMPDSAKGQADRGSGLPSSIDAWLDGSSKKAGDGGNRDRSDMDARSTRVAPPVGLPPPPAAVEPKPATPAPRDTTPPPPAPGADDSSSDPKPRIKQEYIVRSGETVTSISQKVYGKATPRAIDAILSANKKEVPSAVKLRAGAKLRIPELPLDQFEPATFPPSKSASQFPTDAAVADSGAGSGKEKESNESNPGETTKVAKDVKDAKDVKATKEAKGAKETRDGTAAAEKEKPEKPGNYRWYTVQEGETYAAIARRHLGSAERWKEIAELNKGRYADPLRVPAGAKIKLPANNNIGGLSKYVSRERG
jgi:nucleoid-associated protein YgaU